MRTYMTFKEIISSGITNKSYHELWSLAANSRLVTLPREDRQKWRVAVENGCLVWNEQPVEKPLLDTRVFVAKCK